LEAETGKLRQEVLAVRERHGFLQRSVDEYRRQLENQQEHATAMRNEYEKRLKDERDLSYSHVQPLQERILQADLERAQAVKEAQGLHDSLTIARNELTTLREQVKDLQTSITESGDQAKDLTMRNHVLQAENVMLLERGNTIGSRYDANDLVRYRYSIIVNTDSTDRRVSKKRPL
jgi:chromosome segregation ATPase